ncbi:unnamed protein product [Moneuplotes crassus]|uniref:Uncharacterized protein n=1 Tax=Euplotes crassus TaxID=5936 RepID=A0AAD1XF50_EUPCR|nr:unnamed protein product [Moneuplotes crassus]
MDTKNKEYAEALNPSSEDDIKSSMASTVIEPSDRFLFNYFMFLLFGIVLILPFNALILSIGFFESNLPGRDIEFVVSTLTNVPIFIGQILMLFISGFLNLKATIIFSLFGMAGCCMAIPFLTEHITSINTLWIVILISIAIFCFFSGVLQSCAYGYAGIFPQRNIASLSNGTGMSGVVIGILRAISLLSFPVDNDIPRDPNLFTGAILYYSISTAFCIILIVLILISFRTEYSLFYLEGKNDSQAQKRIDSIDNLMKSHQSFTIAISNRKSLARQSMKSLGEEDEEKASILKVHRDNWLNLWGIFLNFVITMVMYPGLLLQGNLSFIEEIDWKVWFVIILFVASDTVGRVLAGFLTLKSPIICGILTLLRSGNVAVAFLSAYDISFFGTDYVVIINIIISGFGLGYLVTSQILTACTIPKPYEMELTGKMINIFLQIGIVVGSLIATFGLSTLF